MPRHNIKGRVTLGAFEELAAKFINDFPLFLLNIVFSLWVQEVARISKPIGAERSQFWELEVRTPDLQNIATGWSIRKVDTETLASLNNYNLARLHVERAKFGLYVQTSLL